MSASGNRFATNSPDDYLYGGRGSVYVFDSDGASWSSPFTLRNITQQYSLAKDAIQLSSNGELLAIGSEAGLVTLFDYTGNHTNTSPPPKLLEETLFGNFGRALSISSDGLTMAIYSPNSNGQIKVFSLPDLPPVLSSDVVSSIAEGSTALGSIYSSEAVTWSSSSNIVSISASGELSLISPAYYDDTPVINFTITATDAIGQTTAKSFSVNVIEDTTPPSITQLYTLSASLIHSTERQQLLSSRMK